MLLLKRLFLPSDMLELKQRHDVPGLIAALGQRFPWIHRNAVQLWGQRQEHQVRAPRTAALNESNSEISLAVQDALDKLKATAPPRHSSAV